MNFKRRKRQLATQCSSGEQFCQVAPTGSMTELEHKIRTVSHAQWKQRLTPTGGTEDEKGVSVCVLFPDHTVIPVPHVKMSVLTSALWDVAQDKDMMPPLDIDYRVLHSAGDVLPREGIYMVYNSAVTNPFPINVTATRILVDQGILELGLVPCLFDPIDKKERGDIDAFFRCVNKYVLHLCVRGPVVFVRADTTNVLNPVAIDFPFAYFTHMYPLFFQQRNMPYDTMLVTPSLYLLNGSVLRNASFGSLRQALEVLLSLRGSVAENAYKFVDPRIALDRRNALLVQFCGVERLHLSGLPKSIANKAELYTTAVAIMHNVDIQKWGQVLRMPKLSKVTVQQMQVDSVKTSAHYAPLHLQTPPPPAQEHGEERAMDTSGAPASSSSADLPETIM